MRLEELLTYGVLIVALGITLAVGAAIVTNTQNTFSTSTDTVINESISAAGVKAFGNQPGQWSKGVYAVSYVMNGTKAALPANLTMCGGEDGQDYCDLIYSSCDYAGGLCNFTYNKTHINITIGGSGLGVVGAGWKVTYTWGNNWSVAKQAANNGTLAIANLSTWIPTIATVIAAVVVIGLIMGAFLIFRKPND